jgi:trimeric autotransporter adhesin
VVSTAPAYEMNTQLEGELVVQVALTGRVPCRVIGTIHKGDLLVASDIPGVAMVLDMNNYQPGCIIGKALQEYDSQTVGVITVVVGKN